MIPISIKHLHIACYIYQTLSKYDESYSNISEIGKKRELYNDDIKNLVHWLRKWGCRQFEMKSEEQSKTNILKWYNESLKLLPANSESILNCSTDNFESLFDSLSNIKASWKNVGPVGAAKILFALRPNVFAPWDNPIMKSLGHKGIGKGYFDYIVGIKGILLGLSEECKTKGLSIFNLPSFIERTKSTLPKLIDEYYWVTITNKFDPDSICKIAHKM